MSVPVLEDHASFGTGSPVSWNDPFVYLLTQTPMRIVWAGGGAVELFFVLSGFVLSLPWLRGRRPSYGEFVVRRVCRIYLPYIVAIAVTMILCHILMPMRLAGQLPNTSEWFEHHN